MDRGTWRATVHGITKNWTHTCTHTIALRTHKEKLYPPLSSVTDTSELMELFFDEGLGMMVDNMKTPGPQEARVYLQLEGREREAEGKFRMRAGQQSYTHYSLAKISLRD